MPIRVKCLFPSHLFINERSKWARPRRRSLSVSITIRSINTTTEGLRTCYSILFDSETLHKNDRMTFMLWLLNFITTDTSQVVEQLVAFFFFFFFFNKQILLDLCPCIVSSFRWSNSKILGIEFFWQNVKFFMTIRTWNCTVLTAAELAFYSGRWCLPDWSNWICKCPSTVALSSCLSIIRNSWLWVSGGSSVNMEKNKLITMSETFQRWVEKHISFVK